MTRPSQKSEGVRPPNRYIRSGQTQKISAQAA